MGTNLLGAKHAAPTLGTNSLGANMRRPLSGQIFSVLSTRRPLWVQILWVRSMRRPLWGQIFWVLSLQDMFQLMNKNRHRTQSKTTCLLKKTVAEGHLPKYKTCPQLLNSQRIHAFPQLILRPPSKVQDMPPTIKLSKNTRHAPTDKPETNIEHKAKPHAY